MGSSTNLNTFPSNRVEALTMLHLKAQNLENKTPEELAELYTETFFKIKQNFSDQRERRRTDS